jgi:hypothetical protein
MELVKGIIGIDIVICILPKMCKDPARLVDRQRSRKQEETEACGSCVIKRGILVWGWAFTYLWTRGLLIDPSTAHACGQKTRVATMIDENGVQKI